MTDMLIRDVPDEVIAAVDAHAARLGLPRSEYVRGRAQRGQSRLGAQRALAQPGGALVEEDRVDALHPGGVP